MDLSSNCMQHHFDFLLFYPWIFANQFERFQFFKKSQYWQFKKQIEPIWSLLSKKKPTMKTGMDKANKRWPHFFHFSGSISHFFDDWLVVFQKLKIEKFKNCHYTLKNFWNSLGYCHNPVQSRVEQSRLGWFFYR